MTRQVPLRELSTVELYALWEAELCQMVRPPNIPLVAACEVHAESRGVRLQDVTTLLARGRWTAALHPRGRDGRFIEVGGLIRLFGFGDDDGEQRGRVTDIIPSKGGLFHKNEDAKIRVSLFDKDGNDTGKIVDASPNQIEQVTQKARLDIPDDDSAYEAKLRSATNPDGTPLFSDVEIMQKMSNRQAEREFARETEIIDNVPNPFGEDSSTNIPAAPGGEGGEPLRSIEQNDMGETMPFASQFTPAARQARADGNTEQVAAFDELEGITSANADPPEIRKNIAAKRDEYVANGEAEKVKVADFTLDAWDNEYKNWEPPEASKPSRPATKEESDAAMNEISSRMLREAGRDTTNFNLADVFTGPGEDSSPSVPLDVPEAPGGEESDSQLDLMGVALGGEPNTTLTPEEIDTLAQAVISGQAIDADPPNLDDIMDKFADRPKGEVTDLTLVPPFSEMRGKGGRKRKEMPQIPPEATDAFNERLRQAGVSVEPIVVDPYALKASQSELDGTKVGGIMRAAKAGKLDLLGNPLWVSEDGYVFDGHHRWAAASVLAANCVDPSTGAKKKGTGCPVEIPVVQVGMPIQQLLLFGDQFNADAGIEKLGVGESRASDAALEQSANAAPIIPAAGLSAAGEGESGVKPPEPDENGNFPMATDAEDFETLGMEWDDAAWEGIEQPESDGEFPPNPNFPPKGTQASLRTASLRARVHGAR